jgi:hypothetical protein
MDVVAKTVPPTLLSPSTVTAFENKTDSLLLAGEAGALSDCTAVTKLLTDKLPAAPTAEVEILFFVPPTMVAPNASLFVVPMLPVSVVAPELTPEMLTAPVYVALLVEVVGEVPALPSSA